MSELPNPQVPNGLDPLVLAEIEQIIAAPDYFEQVRQFRLAVHDGTAYEGAASSREDIENRLGLRR